MAAKRKYGTPEAAKRIGISIPTIRRWLADGRINPGGITIGTGVLRQWSDADIARAKRIKATLKPGRKPKADKKA